MTRPTTLGVISDTHGLLRPEALEALAGVDLILHAGDVGHPRVLEGLSALGEVRVVRGNVDHGAWAKALPERLELSVAGVRLLLLHDAKGLRLPGEAGGPQVVVSGHSHQPGQAVRDGILWFNPGSAGPRRFRLPVCVGRLTLHEGEVTGRLIPLLPGEF